MNIDKLINWGELSRILTGTRSVVTRNRMPEKHESKVNEFMKAVQESFDRIFR
jgi:hypothetical protein